MSNIDSYKQFFEEIKSRIYKSQYETLKNVNKELINLYWNLGKMIHEKQKEMGWGKAIVENLSIDLQKEFVGIKGFSERNIWNMRRFFLEYNDNIKLQPLVAEISWSHNLIIMEKCKDNLEREFYIKMIIKFGWSKNILIHQIENQSYLKYLNNQTNFDNTIIDVYREQAKLSIKDDYIFDFLEMNDIHSEKELERNLINNVQKFLFEMGGYFCFHSNQYKLEIDGEIYYIDLLLYHRILKCFVAIELKIGEFKPEYAGKMEFYLSVLDDKVKMKDENPSIGIIICKSKNRTVVEYALKNTNTPIGVSTYSLIKKLPQSYSELLPSVETIIKRLDNIDVNWLNSKKENN